MFLGSLQVVHLYKRGAPCREHVQQSVIRRQLVLQRGHLGGDGKGGIEEGGADAEGGLVQAVLGDAAGDGPRPRGSAAGRRALKVRPLPRLHHRLCHALLRRQPQSLRPLHLQSAFLLSPALDLRLHTCYAKSYAEDLHVDIRCARTYAPLAPVVGV